MTDNHELNKSACVFSQKTDLKGWATSDATRIIASEDFIDSPSFKELKTVFEMFQIPFCLYEDSTSLQCGGSIVFVTSNSPDVTIHAGKELVIESSTHEGFILGIRDAFDKHQRLGYVPAKTWIISNEAE